MSADTKIEWCHHTFNPWIGCAKVHAGCTHCYAEKHQAVVMRQGGKVAWGEMWAGGQRVVTSESTWRKPYTWANAAAKAGERRRVFCASLADVLEVPTWPERWPNAMADTAHIAMRRVVETAQALDTARARLWDVIRQTAVIDTATGLGMADWRSLPGLDWLLLTKRPENWRLVPEDVRPLVWLGTSVSDQKTADEWVPRLLQAEGFRLRFLSVEPLVGPVDLSRYFSLGGDVWPSFVDWVIVGGESGSKSRPCHVKWVRDIVRQCHEVGVPCFVKQLGAAPWVALPLPPPSVGMQQLQLRDLKGGDPSEWPADLRVRQVPEVIHA